MIRTVLFVLMMSAAVHSQETASDWFARKMRERGPYVHRSSPTKPLESYESRWGEYDRWMREWKQRRKASHDARMRDYDRMLRDWHPLFPKTTGRTGSAPDPGGRSTREITDEGRAVPRWIRASCRVTVSMNNGYRSKGSGAVFAETADAYFVLTNAHVAATRNCYVEFWREGRRSIPIPAPRVWVRNDQSADLAILQLDKRLLFGFEIPVIPLGRNVAAGDQILSAGHANASWQTAWSGQAMGIESPSRMTFVPMPAPGRSGSALFSSDGSTIVGVIGWRSNGGTFDGQHERDGRGYAMPVDFIKRVIGG